MSDRPVWGKCNAAYEDGYMLGKEAGNREISAWWFLLLVMLTNHQTKGTGNDTRERQV